MLLARFTADHENFDMTFLQTLQVALGTMKLNVFLNSRMVKVYLLYPSSLASPSVGWRTAF
jgi:hypothetical protein